MGWPKKKGKKVVGLIVLFWAMPVLAQRWPNISVTVNVPVVFGGLPPAIPGDPPGERSENTLGDVTLSMDGGPPGQGGNVWYVTVQKSASGWHPSLTLWVRRDPTHPNVQQGENYVMVPDAPSSTYFFGSNNQRRAENLGLQHRVDMASLPPMGTYTTTVTYTIFLGTPP